jgi:hypothetical protein
MDKHIHSKYKDKWKKFLKRTLKNIDFLSYGVSESVIEEISYNLEMININAGVTLLESGKPCKEIYIIAQGEWDIFIKNGMFSQYLDTCYTGCSLGSYSILTGDDYSFTAKAKTECSLLKLPVKALELLREQYEDLNLAISEYEDYIDDEGLPYWDYKLYRAGHLSMKPIKKFQHGIRRIMRIVVSCT